MPSCNSLAGIEVWGLIEATGLIIVHRLDGSFRILPDAEETETTVSAFIKRNKTLPKGATASERIAVYRPLKSGRFLARKDSIPVLKSSVSTLI